jgi:nucleotide-binding universal stress UspA family protein
MFKTIVWATDGSELADGALAYVSELAQLVGSRVIAVHADELRTGRYGGGSSLADEPDLREKIERQVEGLRSTGVDATFDLRTGSTHVATLITDAANELEAELIVVGTHGRGGFTAAVMGSVARDLCHTSEMPVLVIPPKRGAKPNAAAPTGR